MVFQVDKLSKRHSKDLQDFYLNMAKLNDKCVKVMYMRESTFLQKLKDKQTDIFECQCCGHFCHSYSYSICEIKLLQNKNKICSFYSTKSTSFIAQIIQKKQIYRPKITYCILIKKYSLQFDFYLNSWSNRYINSITSNHWKIS